MRSLAHVVAALVGMAIVACGGVSAPPPVPDAPTPDAPPSASCPVPTVSFTHTDTGSPKAIYHLLNTTKHPDARCNDGSPGVFTVRPGFGGGAHRWVIYIEGGGSCQTGDDCLARFNKDNGLMSSAKITDGSENTTVFAAIRSSSSTDNPHFYDANFVQIEYCSSDGWTGAMAANPDATNPNQVDHWHFQGRAIIAAVIDELLAHGIAPGDEVLFTGGSAGAVGVYNNLDDVRAQLPASVRLVGVSDAGFILDYPAYDPNTQTESTASPTALEADAVLAAQVWGGHGNPLCEAAATTETQRLLCRAAPSALAGGFVHTPLFIRQSQLDRVQLDRLIPATVPSSQDANVNAYRGRFAARMRDTLTALPSSASPHYAEFSTFDMQHVMIDGPAWLTIAVDNTPLETAIANFYASPCTAPRLIQPPTQ